MYGIYCWRLRFKIVKKYTKSKTETNLIAVVSSPTDKAREDCGSSPSMVSRLKRTVWSFLTDRDSSKAAKVCACISRTFHSQVKIFKLYEIT